jgi:hypothetical protein
VDGQKAEVEDLIELGRKVLICVSLVVLVAPTIVRVLVLFLMRTRGVVFEKALFERGVRLHLLTAILWPGLSLTAYLLFGIVSGFEIIILILPVMYLYNKADGYISESRKKTPKPPSKHESDA